MLELERQPNSDKLLAELRETGCVRFLEEPRRQLSAAMRSPALTTAQEQDAERVQRVIDLLGELPYADYRCLIGALTECRHKPERRFLEESAKIQQHSNTSAALRGALEHLDALFLSFREKLALHAGNNGEDPSHETLQSSASDNRIDHRFAVDAVLLARAVYPFGVNLLTPNWDRGAFVCGEAKNRIWISFGDFMVEIAPKDEASKIKFTFNDGGQIEQRRHILQEGEAALIGRSLHLSSLWHLTACNGSLVSVPVKCDLGDERTHCSRGGLMVVRHGDRVFLFDRGLYNQVQFGVGLETYCYTSTTGHGHDGRLTIGETSRSE